MLAISKLKNSVTKIMIDKCLTQIIYCHLPLLLMFLDVASANETLFSKAFCPSKLLLGKSKSGKIGKASNSST